VSRLSREREKLEFVFAGIKEMPGLPSLVFVVDTKKEEIAVTEAARLGVPIVGVVDTNCDPTPVTFPIPGNDDAIRSIRLFTAMIASTVLESKAYALEGGDEQTVSYGGEETEAEVQPSHSGTA
jgi:small subunit ribosomal protein S2